MRFVIPHDRARRRGFSLIEILVAVTLLMFIIAGLTVMFTGVKSSFRRNADQADVLDSARTTLLLLSQTLQELAPAQYLGVTNFYARKVGGLASMSFELQELFFLSREGDDWRAAKFAVITNSDVSTLFLYVTNVHRFNLPVLASPEVLDANAVTQSNQFRRIIDGVVHLRVTPYDLDGLVVTNDTINHPPEAVRVGNDFYFNTRQVPAYLDLELGILEEQALKRYRILAEANPAAAAIWLAGNQAGRVHMFRQRIPIRAQNRLVQ